MLDDQIRMVDVLVYRDHKNFTRNMRDANDCCASLSAKLEETNTSVLEWKASMSAYTNGQFAKAVAHTKDTAQNSLLYNQKPQRILQSVLQSSSARTRSSSPRVKLSMERPSKISKPAGHPSPASRLVPTIDSTGSRGTVRRSNKSLVNLHSWETPSAVWSKHLPLNVNVSIH